MIITCPGCGASFNVNPDALGAAGRKVRCSKCSHQWLALPDGTSTELDSPVDANPAHAPAAPEIPPQPDIPVPEGPPSAFVAEPDQPVPPLPEFNTDVAPAEPAFAADPQPEPLFSTVDVAVAPGFGHAPVSVVATHAEFWSTVPFNGTSTFPPASWLGTVPIV